MNATFSFANLNEISVSKLYPLTSKVQRNYAPSCASGGPLYPASRVAGGVLAHTLHLTQPRFVSASGRRHDPEEKGTLRTSTLPPSWRVRL